jgi:hypothetical protein
MQQQEPETQVQTRAQALTTALNRPGPKILQDIGKELEKIEEQQQVQTQPQTREERRNQLLQSMLKSSDPEKRNKTAISKALAELDKKIKEEQKTGRGVKKPKNGKGIRKPPRRKAKANPEEKKKDRLRLVVSQIKAGNTNPKLIVEVNKLYKDLYDIDNAHMMLK